MLRNMVLNQSFLFFFIRCKYIPKHNIEGTQRPIKIAWFSWPLKNKISEKISERIADNKSSLSVSVNFLYIIYKFSPTHKAFR